VYGTFAVSVWYAVCKLVFVVDTSGWEAVDDDDDDDDAPVVFR